jgi:hypothetical protein
MRRDSQRPGADECAGPEECAVEPTPAGLATERSNIQEAADDAMRLRPAPVDQVDAGCVFPVAGCDQGANRQVFSGELSIYS